MPVPAGLVLVTSQLCRFLWWLPLQFSFAQCSALEGLSARQVVTVTWDPHPREPIEGVLWAMIMLESTAKCGGLVAEGKMVTMYHPVAFSFERAPSTHRVLDCDGCVCAAFRSSVCL
ncbi:hypothetical protein Taro_041791 [Colocasia esculenta]|uniref:Secreted protein n=1 Tax=Colocasia esculenta TaxID=4460 RepID=A0A843WCC6_COLES|nr:hypothetical protein [Colocasia esculenta]